MVHVVCTAVWCGYMCAAYVWLLSYMSSCVCARFCIGMLGYRQARKIEDVPFPWPYAQMVAFLVFIFAAVFPLLVASQMGSESGDTAKWLPPLITFLTVLSHSGLYGTATTLEDPFVHPPNDLPSVAMQRAFNARLVTSWDALRTPLDDEFSGQDLGDYYLHAEFERQARMRELSVDCGCCAVHGACACMRIIRACAHACAQSQSQVHICSDRERCGDVPWRTSRRG